MEGDMTYVLRGNFAATEWSEALDSDIEALAGSIASAAIRGGSVA